MKLIDKIFKLIFHNFFFKNKVSIFAISKRTLKTTDFTVLSSQSVFKQDLTKINVDQNSQFKLFLSPTITPFSYFFICKEAMIYESYVKDYKNNEYLVESLRNFPSDPHEIWLKGNLMDFLKLIFKKTNIIKPKHNYIYVKNFSNYFHFIYDNLIPLSKIITNNPDEKYKFLIFRPLNKWQKEYYKLIGINLKDFIICKDKSLVKNLTVYTSSRQRFSYSNELLISFKKQILNNFKLKFSDDFNRKIYISRSDSKKRVLQNEIKVINILKKIGFKILVLTELNLESQIKYFFNAKIIVAPHGAGLSNIIYSTNFKLIEIVENNFQKAHFMNLSIQLGGFYHSVCTEIIENKRVVNINKLLKSIDHE